MSRNFILRDHVLISVSCFALATDGMAFRRCILARLYRIPVFIITSVIEVAAALPCTFLRIIRLHHLLPKDHFLVNTRTMHHRPSFTS
jgi:hypothetical protein